LEKIDAVNFSEDDEAEDIDNSFAYCQINTYKHKSGVKSGVFNNDGMLHLTKLQSTNQMMMKTEEECA